MEPYLALRDITYCPNLPRTKILTTVETMGKLMLRGISEAKA